VQPPGSVFNFTMRLTLAASRVSGSLVSFGGNSYPTVWVAIHRAEYVYSTPVDVTGSVNPDDGRLFGSFDGWVETGNFDTSVHCGGTFPWSLVPR
jgi:hypothetical protein